MAQETSFAAWAMGAIGAGITGILGWLALNTMGRISALEQGKVDKKSFDDAMQRADTSRTELRQTMETHRSETRENVIGLHEKIDGLRNHVDEKFDRLADLIRSRS